MKLGIVGDVHGQLDALLRMLARMEAHGVDRLVLLGDVVDRGPDSLGCVRLARTHRFRSRDDRRRRLELVLGNHEICYVNGHFGRPMMFRDGTVGVPIPRSRAIAEGLSAADYRWLDAQPRYLSVQAGGLDLLLVHGGIRREHARVPGWLGREKLDRLTRIGYLDEATGEPLHPSRSSSLHWAADYLPKHGPLVVFGHVTFGRSIAWFPNAICVDTSKRGRLAGLILDGTGEPPIELYEEHEPTDAWLTCARAPTSAAW